MFNFNRLLSKSEFRSSFRCRCCCQVSGCFVTVVLGILISILRHVVNDISPHKTSSPRLPGPGSALAASIHHNELWASRHGMKVSLRVTTYGKWTITLNSDLSFVAWMFFESVFAGNLNLIDSARCLFWWCQADCSLTFSNSNFISTNREDYFCVSLILNGSDILTSTGWPEHHDAPGSGSGAQP